MTCWSPKVCRVRAAAANTWPASSWRSPTAPPVNISPVSHAPTSPGGQRRHARTRRVAPRSATLALSQARSGGGTRPPARRLLRYAARPPNVGKSGERGRAAQPGRSCGPHGGSLLRRLACAPPTRLEPEASSAYGCADQRTGPSAAWPHPLRTAGARQLPVWCPARPSTTAAVRVRRLGLCSGSVGLGLGGVVSSGTSSGRRGPRVGGAR